MRAVSLLVVMIALLSGCAVTPTQVNLVPSGITRAPESLDMELKTITVVIAEQRAQTGKVMIDATFPPLWKESIQTSVDQAGLFKDEAKQKVTISALIKKFEYNPDGFSNTCDTDVNYKVIDRSNGNVLFEKNVVTTDSKSAKEIWHAAVRVITLWNSTAQQSIRQFVDALKQYKMDLSYQRARN